MYSIWADYAKNLTLTVKLFLSKKYEAIKIGRASLSAVSFLLSSKIYFLKFISFLVLSFLFIFYVENAKSNWRI